MSRALKLQAQTIMTRSKLLFGLGLSIGILIGCLGFVFFRCTYQEPSRKALREMGVLRLLVDDYLARTTPPAGKLDMHAIIESCELGWSLDENVTPLDPWGKPYVIRIYAGAGRSYAEVLSVGSGGEFRLIETPS